MKLLAAFLEKDNLKLLVYEGKTRVFAGQLSFAQEVLRDGFIADAAKFAAQVKVAFAQKDALRLPENILLFISPDKVFTKTLPASDSADAFVHGLPYFKEELFIHSEAKKEKVTYVAFEKKLVEDLQRPFQELGKKVIGVESPANVLIEKFPQIGRYLFLIPLEKEIVTVAAENGEIGDLAVIKNEVFTARLEEFRSAHDLAHAPLFTTGVFPEKFNLQTVNLAQTDVYDLIITSVLAKDFGFKLPGINLPALSFDRKYLYLGGAILAGGLLVVGVVKAWPSAPIKSGSAPVTPVAPQPPPKPEPQPKDYPVAILNGTLVTGEAGRLAENLKGMGFEVTETKNATSSGFSATRLRAVKDVPDKIIAELKTALLTTYESVAVEPMATSSGNAVIEIIIGKKK